MRIVADANMHDKILIHGQQNLHHNGAQLRCRFDLQGHKLIRLAFANALPWTCMTLQEKLGSSEQQCSS